MAFSTIFTPSPRGLYHQRRHLRIIPAQSSLALDHGDFAAQPDMCLCHLHPDRATANDQQMLGPFGQVQGFRLGRAHRPDPGLVAPTRQSPWQSRSAVR